MRSKLVVPLTSVAPAPWTIFDVGLLADVLGAFKHHVLEEVGEAGAAGALVERADVIPEVDGDQRQAMVFVGEDDQAVGQREFLVLELGDLQRLCGREGVCCAGAGREGDAEEQRGGFCRKCEAFILFSVEI